MVSSWAAICAKSSCGQLTTGGFFLLASAARTHASNAASWLRYRRPTPLKARATRAPAPIRTHRQIQAWEVFMLFPPPVASPSWSPRRQKAPGHCAIAIGCLTAAGGLTCTRGAGARCQPNGGSAQHEPRTRNARPDREQPPPLWSNDNSAMLHESFNRRAPRPGRRRLCSNFAILRCGRSPPPVEALSHAPPRCGQT
jgi:hypothetical protein